MGDYGQGPCWFDMTRPREEDDELEKLRAENARLRAALEWEVSRAAAVAERNAELAAENARLREALERIMRAWRDPVAPTADELADIAREALRP